MRSLAGTFAINTAVALVLTLLFGLQYVSPRGGGGLGAVGRVLLMNLVISHCIGWLCHFAITRSAPLFWEREWLRWPALTALLLAVGFIGTIAATAVLTRVAFRNARFWPTVWEIYGPAAVITLVVGFTAAALASYGHQLRARELETSAARLASLESRIQPHFLFNALNSIAALIREDPARAERLVNQLSSLLRSSLDTQDARLIPLAREWRLVEDYLGIQQARFDGRLRYELDAAPGLADALVPPFAIQGLVENAVKHAVTPRREGGEIRVTARADAEGARIEIAVADDGPGIPPLTALPKGHGLDNLRSRLASLFGDAAELRIEGSRIAIDLPYRREEAGSARLPG